MLSRMALAAMDSSESVELPLDYLQGHKDGLEWAARLAEANHPETGDWLYDDPIELAKAIRKGPDMPPAQPAPVVPDEKDKTVDADDHPLLWSFNEGWNACRAAMLAASPQSPGSYPATVPGKWIPVSERMPQNDVSVLTFDGMYKRVHHAMYGHWQCWEPEKITHWMPLPAAPQEAINALIPLVSRNEQEGK
ncbi:TPA: DUF551 domain-containing protein [Klebsiella pneumoniae]|nr:DUF551 domain-containing protein [Klebsiella pneumoniae]QBI27355.1 DUF551 domain-containing protein [Klebsiella pneumoniae]HCJ1363454.1 DUF551 domain-containing protein [Klebsiella pneumoniae]HCJ2062031.1 DUF551 domain-containing protein [Klebsiella pneumoniae]